MKTFCRIIAALLVALMMITAFAACDKPKKTEPADKPTQGDDTSESTSEPEINHPDINEKFNGEVIKFAINGEGLNSRSIDLGEEDDPNYEVNVQVSKRNAQVEEELGVDIELAYVGAMQEFFGVLQPILASELYVYDVLGLYQYFDLGLALGDTVGSFYNLLDMPEGVNNYLNLDASYWSRTLLDALSYKDVAFFVTGDLNQSYTSTMFVSYVNAVMWQEYADKIAACENSGGYKDIYDIVNNGYWTLDLWMELAQMAYLDDGDNIPNYTDQAGFMTYDQQLNNIMVDMLVAGSNIRYSKLTGEGTPKVDINNSKNNEFYNKLYQLLCESKTVTIPWLGSEDEDSDLYILDVFAEGKVLLNVNTLAGAEQYLSNMEKDFYVMPLPMFNHEQFNPNSPSKGYTTQLGDSVSQYAICTAIGDEKLPAVTATLELMAFYSELWVTPAYYETALKERYTRDPRNPEMIDMIKEGIYTDFVLIWSSRLDNITWQWRQHFTEKGKIDNNLRSWDRNVTGKLNGSLLEEIETAFWVQK
ncbi:MAG: hypothetical protein IJZ33_04210 [Clostridia bacterium]|nr:hypothetical protein [Clostridia bacterium]